MASRRCRSALAADPPTLGNGSRGRPAPPRQKPAARTVTDAASSAASRRQPSVALPDALASPADNGSSVNPQAARNELGAVRATRPGRFAPRHPPSEGAEPACDHARRNQLRHDLLRTGWSTMWRKPAVGWGSFPGQGGPEASVTSMPCAESPVRTAIRIWSSAAGHSKSRACGADPAGALPGPWVHTRHLRSDAAPAIGAAPSVICCRAAGRSWCRSCKTTCGGAASPQGHGCAAKACGSS